MLIFQQELFARGFFCTKGVLKNSFKHSVRFSWNWNLKLLVLRNFFFVLFKCYSIFSVCLQRTMKKAAFFKVSIDHLFKNPESRKRNCCFEKKSGKSVEFWIQKSVRTPNKLFSSFIYYRERALINDYFTLLASLEYNMQEIQKVQKLANDLVDITVTVR